MTPRFVLRILDANFNRCREGLRVSEEVARFILGDKALTARLKSVRHEVGACLQCLPMSRLVSARDVRGDVGKGPSRLEAGRKDAQGLFLANIQRSKEALRVLEETSKFIDESISKKLKKVRFRVYAIEKRALPKLEALRDHDADPRKKSRRGRARSDRGRRRRAAAS
jgi:thiamine-phosphate pyrophosphorylase